MGKGLLWNGASPSNIPIVFLPLTIAATWPAATNDFAQGQGPPSASQDSAYETIGPHVFRFEYFYLIKNGRLSAAPWNTDAGHTTINGLTDVQAIGVTIAVIDPAGRAIIDAANPSSLYDLASDLTDFTTTPGRGVGPAAHGPAGGCGVAALAWLLGGGCRRAPGAQQDGGRRPTPSGYESSSGIAGS